MNINKQIKEELEKLFKENRFNCRSISISTKEKDGEDTSEICITVGVPEKKPLDQLTASEIVPDEIEINGQKFKTDVKEIAEIKAMECFSSGDDNILKLQGNPSLLTPLKGGQEIIKFPRGWSVNAQGNITGFSVGTLGLFVVDDIDDKIVGITNTHVAVDKLRFTGERDAEEESTNPFNTKEEEEWVVDEQLYPTGGRCRSGTGFADEIIDTAFEIKRYQPISGTETNYVDAALLIMNPTHISESDSFKIHHPDSVTEYSDYLPFATTEEIDSLLDSPKPRLFSTGRTTGPKGWGEDPACIINAVGVSTVINVGFSSELTATFGDIIHYQHADGSAGVIDGGDSGSILLADFGGVKKVIGLAFAGSTDETNAFACRIDRIAESLKIREWDSSYVYDSSVPTVDIISEPIEYSSSNELSIIHNGKEYFQVGSTTELITPTPSVTPTPSISGGSSTLWTPTEITTTGWYDETTHDLDISDRLQTWNDNSGNNHPFSQTTSSERPSIITGGLNGKPVVDFDGVDHFLESGFEDASSFFNSGLYYAWVVFKADTVDTSSVNGYQNDGIWSDEGGYVAAFAESGGPNAGAYVYDGANNTALSSYTIGDWAILGTRLDGGLLGSKLNGDTEQTAASGFIQDLSYILRMGKNYDEAWGEVYYFDGQIAEVIFTNTSISSVDIERIEGYLAHKWGLTSLLPVGHAYKNSPPTI
jgi:hypothetical protein